MNKRRFLAVAALAVGLPWQAAAAARGVRTGPGLLTVTARLRTATAVRWTRRWTR